MREVYNSPKNQAEPKKLEFHLIKSNYFRVIHVDGAWGSVTPSGNNIQMVVYSHRMPIPQTMVHPIVEGKMGDASPSEQVGKSGIVREMESALILDLDVAQALYKWLGTKIEQLQKIKKEEQ